MKPGHLYRSPAAGSRAASPGCCWSWNCLCAEPQWCSCGSQWWCKRRWVAQRLQGNSSPPGCSAERWSPACHWWCRCCRPPEWWRSVPGPPSPWEKKKKKKRDLFLFKMHFSRVIKSVYNPYKAEWHHTQMMFSYFYEDMAPNINNSLRPYCKLNVKYMN